MILITNQLLMPSTHLSKTVASLKKGLKLQPCSGKTGTSQTEVSEGWITGQPTTENPNVFCPSSQPVLFKHMASDGNTSPILSCNPVFPSQLPNPRQPLRSFRSMATQTQPLDTKKEGWCPRPRKNNSVPSRTSCLPTTPTQPST